MGISGYLQDKAQEMARKREQRYGVPVETTLGQKQGAIGPMARRVSFGKVLLLMLLAPVDWMRDRWSRYTDRDTVRRAQAIRRIGKDLRWRVSEDCRIIEDFFERSLYSRDMARVPSFLQKFLHRTQPLVVAQPVTESDVVRIVEYADEWRTPFYPRGVASWAFGGAVPTRNGIVIDLGLLRNIVEVDAENLRVTVEPGLRWSDLALELRRFNLAPLTTPSSRFSSVGGWAATGGLGIEAFGYGSFHDAVLSLRVVTPKGKVLTMNKGDKGFADYLGTEGQLGIITSLTFQVRRLPKFSAPLMVHFDTLEKACDYARQIVEGDFAPTHVALYNAEAMAEKNALFADKTDLQEKLLKESPAVFLHFDDEKALAAFKATSLPEKATLSEGVDARYLWSERYFPLKGQRLGPSLLACEMLVPYATLGRYIRETEKIAERFGLRPGYEAIFSRTANGPQTVVIAAFPCDFRHRINYALRMTLVQLMSKKGVDLGARPYGYGIWNAPFFEAGGRQGAAKKFARQKAKADPQMLLNPNKYYRFGTRMKNIPGLLFRPSPFYALLGFATKISALLGAMSLFGAPKALHRWRPPMPGEEDGRLLVAESAVRCTHCGACVAVCPAYFLTHQELTTGRGKLQLGERMMEKDDVGPDPCHAPFQCMRCGLCEEVCQTGLPLRDCYSAIENWVSQEYETPVLLMERFTASVDENRDLIARRFGLRVAPWSPGQIRIEASTTEGGRS